MSDLRERLKGADAVKNTTTCSDRHEDCRCVWAVDHVQLHMCYLPGCGALWTSSGEVVRIPFQQELPRHYGRPDLRVA